MRFIVFMLVVLLCGCAAEEQSTVLAPFRKEGKVGFINPKGEVVIKPMFDEMPMFNEGLAVVRFGDKFGYIDATGKLVIDTLYRRAQNFTQHRAAVMKDSLFGFINPKGEVVIPFQFKETQLGFSSFFSDGLCAIQLDGKWGYIDTNGKVVIPPQFHEARAFYDGIAAVQVNLSAKENADRHDLKWGFINKKGKYITQPQFHDVPAGYFSEGLCVVEERGRYGYVNKNGASEIGFNFLSAQPFRKGVAAVMWRDKKGAVKWGLIDRKGTLLAKYEYDRLDTRGFIESGLIAAGKKGKAGFIDEKGKWVIEPKYDYVYGFSSGLAVAYLERQCGFIDRSGKWVIEPQFENAGSFYDVTENLLLAPDRFYDNIQVQHAP